MHRPVEILLVEDSPADARLVREALHAGAVPKNITVVTDGAQAIDYLRRSPGFEKSRRPDLILLDLNLPKRDGLEVLHEIKTDPELRVITVIVLTTSQYYQDVNSAYELAANCYIVKPGTLDQFYSVMHGIEEFWMTMAALPTLQHDPLPEGESDKTGGEPSEGQSGAASASVSHDGPREPLPDPIEVSALRRCGRAHDAELLKSKQVCSSWRWPRCGSRRPSRTGRRKG